MYDDDKTATDDQFYYDLINRFFNPRSYFYYCIETYLNRPSLIANNPEASTIQFIARFIDFLMKSKKTTADLKEITLIKGFEYTYVNLENQLIRYDLKSLDQTQVKKAIQKISLSFLKDIYQALITHPKSRKTLRLYIAIKSKLSNLLNGSNGKHTNNNSLKSIKPNLPLSDESPIQLSNEPPGDATEDSGSELSNENARSLINGLQNTPFREDEQYSPPESEQENSGSFEINTSFKEFKTSSTRSTTKVNTPSILSGLFSEPGRTKQNNDEILIPGDDDDEELLKLIQEIDSYKESLPLKNFAEIKALKNTNSTNLPFMEEIAPPIQNEDDQNDKAEEYSNENDEKLEGNEDDENDKAEEYSDENDEKLESNEGDENVEAEEDSDENDEKLEGTEYDQNDKAEEYSNKNDEKLEGNEDDENDKAEEYSDENDEKLESNEGDENVEAEEDSDENDEKLEGTEYDENDKAEKYSDENDEKLEVDEGIGIFHDESINKIFQQEAVLYYKILSEAIPQLKSDEKIQSALEDIELASSSLKHLAQKLGMEKLALLPELIESVSSLSNKHIIKPPTPIVLGIEDGVNLIKEFNVNNTDHRAKYMSILILLKEYYMKTLNKTRKFSVSF